MLDQFAILTKGGIVLWAKHFSDIASNRSGPGSGGLTDPIDALIKDVFVEERTAQFQTQGFEKDYYRLKWSIANDLELIFVAVYQKVLQLSYVDELLDAAKRKFCSSFAEKVRDRDTFYEYPFDEAFDQLRTRIEAKSYEENKRKGPRKFQETKKFQTTLQGSKAPTNDVTDNSGAESPPSSPDPSTIAKNIEKLHARGRGKGRRGKGAGGAEKSASPDLSSEKKGRTKVMRTWGDGPVTKDHMKALDYSESTSDDAVVAESLVDRKAMGKVNAEGFYEAPEMEDTRRSDHTDDDADESEDDAPSSKTSSTAASAKKGGVFSFFQNLTGVKKELTESDLVPVMSKMKEHLINKNVAADIASVLCESVAKGMVGQKPGTFQSVSSLVKENMQISLQRILTPRSSTDILRDIQAARSSSQNGGPRPYSVVFVGVNGVGKSTNLSKVCFWLLQNRLKVLIAACDTFRSGAVEQLRVHARNLRALGQTGQVDLFERGYGKDSAGIARDAINYAKAQNYDVVLVDTAGRMQDNEPLMRALAKLVTVNNPDKIIFVGEALVGNEAVDQLTKFNRALKDFSGVQVPRQIDGIILTKFDTIDDKVGAALSMTYITGQPILFVGTGQTYTDLRKMNVGSIVNSLLAA
ncbi:hypothetical protein HK102_001857 [Quaeritorhiza haematococci]|nr:hypothetical protein HK102_001857 [Quaeritorhiza haematococci]